MVTIPAGPDFLIHNSILSSALSETIPACDLSFFFSSPPPPCPSPSCKPTPPTPPKVSAAQALSQKISHGPPALTAPISAPSTPAAPGPPLKSPTPLL